MCMSTVFFFKQKTTYEMRISDWSSDVCSSELGLGARLDPEIVGKRAEAIAGAVPRDDAIAGARQRTDLAAPIFLRAERAVKQEDGDPARAGHAVIGEPRSEEHTSELQSLMRISYAVFCLKKKKTSTQKT